MRRAAKRDLSEAPIVKALRRLGQSVWSLNWTMDLLCLDHSTKRFWVAENKTGKAALTDSQERFVAEAVGAPVFILRGVEDAADAVNRVRCST